MHSNRASMRFAKPIFLFVLVLCGCLLLPFSALAKAPVEKPFTVVIDAGHGGKDPGAVGKISQEKNLNLDVSLLVGKLLSEQFPDIKVVYTRQTDIFLPLQQRADIVNANNADLFICIHTNSSESKTAQGVETFVLGTEKMDKNLDVAMRENSVIKLEADYQTAYQGFDPNSIDSYIMFELMQNAYMDQSLRFATLVQRQCVERLKRAERGVRQAAFWVLLKSACPSILFEMGFISNPEEEKYLNSTQGQQEIAQSICNAFAEFVHRKPAPQLDTAATQPAVAEPDTAQAQKTEPARTDTLDALRQEAKTEPKTTTTPDTIALAPQQKRDTAVLTQPLYAIQVLASRVPVSPDDSRLYGLKCKCLELDGWYKYYYGESADRNEVVRLREQIRNRFPDCWIIQLTGNK